jgi:hypothetical protein
VSIHIRNDIISPVFRRGLVRKSPIQTNHKGNIFVVHSYSIIGATHHYCIIHVDNNDFGARDIFMVRNNARR